MTAFVIVLACIIAAAVLSLIGAVLMAATLNDMYE